MLLFRLDLLHVTYLRKTLTALALWLVGSLKKSSALSHVYFHFQDEQVEEIRDIIELKVIHRRNIIKRKAKWGFESNSLIGLDLAGAANVIAPDAVDDEDF